MIAGQCKMQEKLPRSQECCCNKDLIDPERNEAFGVRFTVKGVVEEVKTKKEVVLSGGSILTPQLLMLSGIGPKNHLKELGIPVVKDLPVGYNLIDHPIYVGLVICFEKSSLQVPKLQESIYQYLLNRDGLLANVGASSFVVFARTKYADKSNDEPDIQMSLLVSDGVFSLRNEFTGTTDDIKHSFD